MSGAQPQEKKSRLGKALKRVFSKKKEVSHRLCDLEDPQDAQAAEEVYTDPATHVVKEKHPLYSTSSDSAVSGISGVSELSQCVTDRQSSPGQIISC